MKAKVHTDMDCFSDEHLKWISIVGLPIIVVWVVTAPVIALVLLFVNRNKTDNNKAKEYLLILYQGLKPDRFYWEFVNTFRKVLILIMFAILSQFSISMGIILVIVLLVAIIRVQQKLDPYKESYNNEIEIKAIETGIITLDAGLIFMQENSFSVLNTLVLILVVVVNVRFILEWLYLFAVCMSERHTKFKLVSMLLLYMKEK